MDETVKPTTTILNCLDQIENVLFDFNIIYIKDTHDSNDDNEEIVMVKLLFEELTKQFSKSCSVIKEQIDEIEKANIF